VDQALKTVSCEFDALYAEGGRASIAPERFLRALLLQLFCCPSRVNACGWKQLE
jgi:hypothetical protein